MEYNIGLSEDILYKIKEIVNRYNDYEFYIFGSRAKGTYKKTSDIDIAIYETISERDKYKIANEFDLLDIIYKIDLVFISQNTKKELLESIEKNKIRL